MGEPLPAVIGTHDATCALTRGTPEALPDSHERAKRVEWLGGRDSNPDNHVQSVVSYR